ncbi:MAG: hypothetical protein HPY55_06580 [Firmicutes bacterium]|nr:hypothetical protein [Bacillota bacterium]
MRFAADKLPDSARSLPGDIQALWLEVANGIPEGVEPAVAEKAAWAAVAEMGYQLVDGKWVPAQGAALAGPIVHKDAAQRKVYGPVLVPGEPDTDGETVTAEKIAEVAETWLTDYGNVDVIHSLNNVGKPCQSYITPMDLTFGNYLVPKGSWMLGVKVNDDATWARVESGELTGFSVMGVPQSRATKAGAQPQPKRVLLRDLGPDWIATHVSLVKTPAVPKAKWIAVKHQEETGKDGLLARITKAVAAVVGTGASKAGRKYSDKDFSKLQEAARLIGELLADAEAERAEKSTGEVETVTPDEIKALVQQTVQATVQQTVQTMVQQAVEAALKPLDDRLKAVEAAGKPAGQDGAAAGTAGAAGNAGAAGKSQDDPLKELSAKVDELSRLITPATKGLVGQDGGVTGDAAGGAKKSAAPDRDGFGRKIR